MLGYSLLFFIWSDCPFGDSLGLQHRCALPELYIIALLLVTLLLLLLVLLVLLLLLLLLLGPWCLAV